MTKTGVRGKHCFIHVTCRSSSG